MNAKKTKYKKTNTKKVRDNKREQRIHLVTIGALLLAVVFMAIGFAAYTQTLNINGTANVGSASWNVHWETGTTADQRGEWGTTSSSVTNDTVTLSCTLSVTQSCGMDSLNAINEGTYDAKLSSITVSGPTTAQQKYICVAINGYSSSFDEWWYTPGCSSVAGSGSSTQISFGTAANVASKNVTIPKKSGSTNGDMGYQVFVKYYQPSSSSDLPTSNQTVTVTIALKYDQV
ncbi:hypothetical protein IJJ54_00150 [Candidatus Saccharibacteria bacterium]|nr:hypothetical protein [Candidatus Saccharibacteria bacterium]